MSMRTTEIEVRDPNTDTIPLDVRFDPETQIGELSHYLVSQDGSEITITYAMAESLFSAVKRLEMCRPARVEETWQSNWKTEKPVLLPVSEEAIRAEYEAPLKLAEEALEELHYSSGTVKAVTLYKSALAAIREALSEPVNTRSCSEYSEVKQEPVAFKFPREPKPENAMGWTVDYGLIRDIAEAIGDQEFHPGYEGIELTLIALEIIYAAPVSAKREWVDLTDDEEYELAKQSEGKSRHWLVGSAIAAFKEKNK